MATQGGPPPPPPPPGQFRPPPQQGGPAPPRPQGGQGPPPQQFMLPIRQPLQQSTRIQDITPPMILNEAACLKKLTTYAAYTIRKVAPRDAKERPTWARAEVIEEKFPQEEVSKQIKKLNESKRTVTDKKTALAPFQQGQITSLLDDLGSKEMDPNFQWSLVQISTREKPVSSRTTSKKSLYETVTMTVFVKRAPGRDVNPIQLFQTLERIKADRLRGPPPGQPKQQQPQQQGGGGGGQGGGGGGHGGPPGGHQQQGNRAPPPPPGFVQLNNGGPPHGGNHSKPQIMKQPQKGAKHRTPKKYHGRSSSSSGSSDSGSYDSDSMSESATDSDSLGTSISAESKRHRRNSKGAKGATRRHSFHRESRSKYYLEARSPSPPRHHRASDAFGGIPPQHRPYAPDVPRAVPGVDPITSAYQAGKEDAMAERFGADRFAQQAQQIAQPVVQVVERIIEPRPVVSYGRMEPPFAERPRLIEPRYIDDRYVDDLRSVEDDFIVRQRRAEDYIDRRPIELDRRPDLFDRRPSDFERRPVERPDFERRYSEVRPLERREFLDRSPVGRDFPRYHSPPRAFPGDSHPFAPTPLPRRYPQAPSISSSGFDHGW